MNNTFQVQVVRRGIITLPKELRDHNNIEEGDTLTLIDLGDGVVVMSPRRSRVDEIANKLAKEWQDSVLFLHKIAPGPADRSYGIHVGQLAGLPEEVIQRAKKILTQLEKEHFSTLKSKTKVQGDLFMSLSNHD